MYDQNLDSELEDLEATGETEAEWIDQETELQDVEDDEDEYLGEDAEESDLERAYASFSTPNENDYDGYDPSEVDEDMDLYESSNVLESKPDAFHLVDDHDYEEEHIDMEIEDGDIQAILVDEDGNEVGFVLLDDNGNEQEYFYVSDDDGTTVDAEGDIPVRAVRLSDGEEFSLDVTEGHVTDASPFAERIVVDD